MKTFTKKYQLWTYADGAYTFKEFDSLAECISEPKYSEWYITKGVVIAVTEAPEAGVIGAAPFSAPPMPLFTSETNVTDEEKDFAAKMRGPIALIG